MKMRDFVHLHLHTEYSLLDGNIRLDKIQGKKDGKAIHAQPLKEAMQKYGMKSVAITDHGNMFGVYKFVESLKGSGIKPIIGCEFYTCPNMKDHNTTTRNHLVLLAKNEQGYRNLMKLISQANVDGFYYKPRIDFDILSKYTDGLVCLSGCLAGVIPQLLLKDEYEKALAHAKKMKDIFAEGDYYIEIQDHGLPEQKKILNPLVQIAKEVGVKVVATNDCHYVDREDAEIQDTLLCCQTKAYKNDVRRMRMPGGPEYYIKSKEEMNDLFGWIPEALDSTIEIAEKCNFDFPLKITPPFIPPYTNDEMNGRTTDEYIRDLTWERIHWRYDTITDEIKERIEYELKVIIECGYSSYFLIVWDFINEARKMGISIGPGRGSGVGSIVAYAMGITQVDPLRYNLIFERFLSKERVSMPDFDVDICFQRRQEVIDYVERKYGKPNVTKIAAYSTMATKAVVKDIARVYEVPYATANEWVKLIPDGLLLGDCLGLNGEDAVPDFLALYQNNFEAKKVIDEAMKLEGMPRQLSMHAAGVVICTDPVDEHVPLFRNKEDIVTQFDKTQIEALGLLKMDFLGLKTLTDISEALKYIKEDKGVEIDFEKMVCDDQEVFKVLSGGDCEAVFQLESGGMKKFMADLKPDSLEEIIAGISLYRPGPIQFLGQYIEGKQHPENVVYAHPLLKDILEVTHGCIVYQEQVMQIARVLAGYTFGGADLMRRAMAKKKKEVLIAQKKIFIHGGDMSTDKGTVYVPGAVANGVPEEVADALFEQILKFSAYAFNKSHAAAYAVVSYRTAYLKRYFPVHFIIAVANNRISMADEVQHYIGYLKSKDVELLPPHINKSKALFTIENDAVRFGLMAIKNVGLTAIEEIISEREKNGEYKDLRDLLSRNNSINKRMIENLIKAGALDCFQETRATLFANYSRIVDIVASEKKNACSEQISFFDDGIIEDVQIKYDQLPELDKKISLQNEKEVLGMYLSGHPLDEFKNAMSKFEFATDNIFLQDDVVEMVEENEQNMLSEDEEESSGKKLDMNLHGKRVKFGAIFSTITKKMTKDGTKSFFVGQLEDLAGVLGYAMYAPACNRYEELLQTSEPVVVEGRLNFSNESEPKIVIDKLSELIEHKKVHANVVDKKETILWVLLEDRNQKNLVESVLSMYDGSTVVKAQVVLANGYGVQKFNSTVTICDELLEKLKNILGERNIKIVSK